MTYRDREGFGRPEENSRNVFSVVGPDDADHSINCSFYQHRGLLPCNCDASRGEFSFWWKCWMRWQKARVERYAWRASARVARMPWPVMGPDRDPWIPGVDFNDTNNEG